MAVEGHDVDTAPPDKMVFSTEWPSMRVRYTGLVTATTITHPWSSLYDIGIVTYPVAFASPPIVLVAGQVVGGVSDQKSSVLTDAFAPGGYSFRLPWYTVNSLADRFELYVYARDGAGPIPGRVKTYRYYVFDSPLGG